jgi:WD40 repeat protein
MPVVFICPNCNSKLRLPDHLAGRAFACPRCKASVRAPDASATQPPPGPAASVRPAAPVLAVQGAARAEHPPTGSASPRSPVVLLVGVALLLVFALLLAGGGIAAWLWLGQSVPAAVNSPPAQSTAPEGPGAEQPAEKPEDDNRPPAGASDLTLEDLREKMEGRRLAWENNRHLGAGNLQMSIQAEAIDADYRRQIESIPELPDLRRYWGQLRGGGEFNEYSVQAIQDWLAGQNMSPGDAKRLLLWKAVRYLRKAALAGPAASRQGGGENQPPSGGFRVTPPVPSMPARVLPDRWSKEAAYSPLATPRPAGKNSGEPGILHGHTGAVRCVAFSPDNKTLASCGDDNGVRVWDAEAETEIATLSGHTKRVSAVAFSADGTLLASASVDATIRLWSLKGATPTVVFRYFSPDGVASGFHSLAFAPSGSTLAAGNFAGHIVVADLLAQSVKVLRPPTVQGFVDTILGVRFSPDGQQLASGSAFRGTELWDASSRRRLDKKDQRRAVNAVAFSPGGKLIASGVDDGKIALWPLAGGQVRTLQGHEGAVYAVAFAPDGTLVSAGADRTIKFWDKSSGTVLATVRGHGGAVLSLAVSPDGKRLASAGQDRAVRLWDLGKVASPPAVDKETEGEIRSLVAGLKFGKPAERVKAAAALAALGPQGRAASRALCEAMLDADPQTRLAATEALQKVNQPLHEVVVPLLVERDYRRRSASLRKLAGLGKEAQPAVPILVFYHDDHLAATSAPGRARPGDDVGDGPFLVETLVKVAGEEAGLPAVFSGWLLGSKNGHVKVAVAQALPRLPTGVGAIGALLQSLRTEPDLNVRAQVTHALGLLVPKTQDVKTQKAAVALLALAARGERSEVLRALAAEALGRIGPAARDAVPALTAAKTDPAAKVREAAQAAVEKIQAGTPE